MENVIIIGTGCAGLTAAIYTARASLEPLVIEGMQPGGQLTTTTDVENFPGFPEGIDGFTLTDNMRKQATRFGTKFEGDTITSVDFSGPVKKLFSASKTYEAKTVIIATGAAPRMTGVAGEAKMFGGKGVSTCATCDGAFYRGMDVAIIGGGDSACEEAQFLTRFANKVYLIHRRNELRASKIVAEQTLNNPKITAVWDSVPEEILADDKGFCRAIRVKNVKDNSTKEIEVKGVFVAIGHIPNTQIFSEILPLDENGYFVTECGTMVKTKIPGVFVAGDCADHVYRQAITAAGMGCQAAIEAERFLTANQ